MCWKAALPEGGPPDKMYFDADTGLPVRLISQHHSAGRRWRSFRKISAITGEVDGVMLPFQIAQTGGESAVSW